MKAYLLGGAAAAMLAFAPAIAQTAAQPTQAAPPSKAAKVHTRAEVQEKVTKHFARLDTDRDGFITQAEADAARARFQARIAQRGERRGSMRAHLFDRLDANKDGSVTRAEAEAVRAERQGQAATGAQARPDRMAAMFQRFDSNNDGTITRAEFDAAASARAARTPRALGARGHGRMGAIAGRMFAAADADKDGRVSLQEATAAALTHFDHADANRDGQVTADERRKMMQQMRASRQPG